MNTKHRSIHWGFSMVMLVLMKANSLADSGGAWSPAGQLTVARSRHTATRMMDGRVLVAGGQTNSPTGIVPTASAEIYDPATGLWTPTGSLLAPRSRHAAILLPGGKVLVIGGRSTFGATASAELFDPASGSWSSTGSMTTARDFHTATLLADGRVLVAGGLATADGKDNPAEKSAEIHDPATGSWTAADHMAQARWGHTATVLGDGSVLVAGGTGPALDGMYTVRAEIYHPGSNRWRSVDPMATARGFHIATRLADGSVLIAGGLTHPHQTVNVTGASELFEPATGRWKPTGNLSVARGAGPHGAVLLLDGRFLVAGGRTFTAEIYNPATAQWQFTGSMSVSRSSHTLTLLGNGDVLAAGGENFNGIISTAELFKAGP